MSKLIEELELKFNKFETRIRDKINYLNDLCTDQEAILNERFNIDNLLEKYSNGLNNQRQLLLNQISTHLSIEIAHINEIVGINENNSKEKENGKKLKFKCWL